MPTVTPRCSITIHSPHSQSIQINSTYVCNTSERALSTSTLQVLALICDVVSLMSHTNGVAIWWQPQAAFVLRDFWCLPGVFAIQNAGCTELEFSAKYLKGAVGMGHHFSSLSRSYRTVLGKVAATWFSSLDRCACGPGIPGEFEFQPGYARLSAGLHHWIAGASFQSLDIWQVRRHRGLPLRPRGSPKAGRVHWAATRHSNFTLAASDCARLWNLSS